MHQYQREESIMSLLKQWREFAYSHDDRTQDGKRFWIGYFQQEKTVYEEILEHPDEPVSGTVKELAEKYNISAVSRIPLDMKISRLSDSGMIEAYPGTCVKEVADRIAAIK